MFIVVDSGSTKADWVLVKKNGERSSHTTMGLNPYYHDADKVYSELSKESFTRFAPVEEISKVFFYGAGCDDFYKEKMYNSLTKVFIQARIEVAHDLLGAARAACGKNPGIAAILGTGSSSCLYDGKNITDHIQPLSYVIGDEGAGVHLGKLTLQAYFYREFPKDLHDDFNQTYPEGGEAIIGRVYGEGANVELAKFASFLVKHREHAFAQNLIQKSFSEFLNRHVKKYENAHNQTVSFVGSIAKILEKDLAQAMAKENLKLGNIVQKPIEALVAYHSVI